MNEIVTKIKDFFDKNNWNYSFDEEKSIFTFGIDMNNILGSLSFFILIGEMSYTVYAVFNNKVEFEKMNEVGEYLHRANYGLRAGNFEMDYDDGEIRYKNLINYTEASLIDENAIMSSIFIPATMFDKYGKGLFKIMLSNSNPKELIEIIEKQSEVGYLGEDVHN